MRIKSLKLENFRGFKDLTLEFDDAQTTVLIGVNGSGKSSVLDAIAMMLSFFVTMASTGERDQDRKDRSDLSIQRTYHRSHREPQAYPRDSDIRIGSPECRSNIVVSFDGMSDTWQMHCRPGNCELSGLKKLSLKSILLLREHQEASLPVAIYYPVERSVSSIPLGLPDEYYYHQVTAYEDAVNTGRREFEDFFKWYRGREDVENEVIRVDHSHRDKQLEAVRNAVYNLIPGFRDLRVRRSPTLGMIVTKGSEELDVRQLSDGEKCLLAMAGDIARRLSIANPALENPLEGKGVVLIDEIDLHLHPSWQRKVIPALERTFPNLQFIVATHSPQVLSSAENATVLLLSPGEDGITARKLAGFFGRDTNWILEVLMEVDERPTEIKEKIEAFLSLIDDGRLDEGRAAMEDLAGQIGRDDPEIVRGEVLIRRKEILGR
ncbi:AAA family ATPase [Thermodesulfobacteriota bacterium]